MSNKQTLATALNNRNLLEITTALSFIPATQRKVFLLRFAKGYSEEETAKYLDTQVNLVTEMENYALKVFLNGLNKLPVSTHQTTQTLK